MTGGDPATITVSKLTTIKELRVRKSIALSPSIACQWKGLASKYHYAGDATGIHLDGESVLINYHFQAMVKTRFDVEPEYQNLFFQVNFLIPGIVL